MCYVCDVYMLDICIMYMCSIAASLPDEKHGKGEETEQGDCVGCEETGAIVTWIFFIFLFF